LVYASRQTGAPISFNYRIIRKDGAIRHIHAEVRYNSDANGKPWGLYGVTQDITEQKKAEDEIKHLNETLEERVQARTADLSEANKALEAFSSTVSHDLRAPVRAVNSFAKLIQDEYGDKMAPREKELLRFIEEAGLRMSAIIDDLLKLAKYGNEKLKFEPVNMTRLVQGIWLNISRITPHCAVMELSELPMVQVDMSMMQQVVVNLLSNAIKYSSKKENPVVKIWAGQEKNTVTFYFKDNGAGFDMKNYEKLFGAFHRLHSQRDFEGTGVGLTLVKRIIEKHGGQVGAEGKVNEGATFYFTLPVHAD
jgi:light-regulated signal transduction histidine kinase (bacteriophytochrome)